MVKEAKKGKKTLFVCEVCGFAYEERSWAELCEKYCGEHHACNLEVTQHAVLIEEG